MQYPTANRRRLLTRYPRAVPLAIFLLVAAVTVLSVFAIEQGETEREAAELDRQAQAMSSTIERRASASAASLRAGAALFGTQARVDADLFRRFVAELRLDTDYQGSEGIGWAPVVAAAGVPAFEAEMNASRMAMLGVRPTLAEQPRDLLVPILFLQPDTLRNRRAIGFDMYSEAVRREAMDRAVQSSRPTASGRVTLVQRRDDDGGGFLIYMPVFDQGGDGRRLRGFIYSPFSAGEFLTSAADIANQQTGEVALYDVENGRRVLMARFGEGRDGAFAEKPLTLANREMVLRVQSARVDVLSPMSMVTLLFGIAVASARMVRAAELDPRFADSRTQSPRQEHACQCAVDRGPDAPARDQSRRIRPGHRRAHPRIVGDA